MAFETGRATPWAIILAGGEGMRLRPLTRRIAGDERPKQFCPLVNGETLLGRTRRRVRLSVKPEQTCLVLTRPHERFYAPLVAGAPSSSLIVQPWGRGTAPATLYGRLRIAEAGRSDAVDLRPLGSLRLGRCALHGPRPGGVACRRDAPGSGRAARHRSGGSRGAIRMDRARRAGPRLYPVYWVRQFWEKPELAVAERLLRRGCLWNSFALVARVRLYPQVMTSPG
jgi:mannose-1-phosphate guanylyltransferase